MMTRSLRKLPAIRTLALILALIPLQACRPAQAKDNAPQAIPSTTNIVIGPEKILTNAKPLGINLGGQDFYDSGQMLRNLTFRNPGFEAGTWQSILHCKSATNNTCTDENQYTTWPVDFLKFAHYEDLTSGAIGQVQATTAATNGQGITLTLTSQPKPGDFLLLRIEKPGNAEAGWWKSLQGGATLATETHDLSPNTPGKQALRVEAAAPGQSASVSSYFDSYTGRSFLQLRGHYTLTFRAKRLAGTQPLNVRVERLDTTHGLNRFLTQDIPLTTSWHDYTFAFDANEFRSAVGTVGLTFSVSQSTILLDDVALTAPAAPNNPTPFRDEVVQTLRDLHPGVLRYMDSGGNFGSSLDNMLAPVFARQRAGSSTQEVLHDDIPLGLHEFLQLCEAIGAEPWYSMPPGSSPAEAAALAEYLAGPITTPYGRKRAALGHPIPWTTAFPTIHLELGNEEWNARSFYGSSINEPTTYARRASAVYAALRAAPSFHPQSFDLILGSWATVPWWTSQELASSTGIDSIAIAPYLFTEFKDASSLENIFGPMLAQPEMIDGPTGYMGQQREAARKAPHPANLAIYETNLGTMSGTALQPDIDQTVPSLGAGLAVADHMLLMLRDLGITTQCLFALPEYVNDFLATAGGPKRTIPLWGAVVDMGGATDLRRPSFYALQLANQAILPTMLATHLSAPNPTWNQSKSPNDSIELKNAHELQTFAFTDGPHHSLILLNLSRTDTIPVTISVHPAGQVNEVRLTAPHITDSNEKAPQVLPTHRTLQGMDPTKPYYLPPYSMTALTW